MEERSLVKFISAQLWASRDQKDGLSAVAITAQVSAMLKELARLYLRRHF